MQKNKYSIIYADPPWRYKDNSCRGACEHHYKTLSLEQICNLPIKNFADTDCILFLWATYPQIREALQVIDAWGFQYKTIGFQWIKQNKSGKGFFWGLGRWTRSNTEACLLATKGKPKRINAGISQLIIDPVRSHSQKPNCVRDKIIQLCGDLPRIELFARERVDGWDAWGDQIESDIVL